MSLIRLVDRTNSNATLQHETITSLSHSEIINLEGAKGCSFISQVTNLSTSPALSGASAWLEASLDAITFITIAGSIQAITGSDNIMWNVDIPYYKFIRVAHDLSQGSLAIVVRALVKGEYD